MRCPQCGAAVPDGALSCPQCHLSFGVTQKISLNRATWCPSCGALVAPGQDVCPKCGSSIRSSKPAEVPQKPPRPTRELNLPEIGNTGTLEAQTEDGEPTDVLTRIESAIPPVDDVSTPSTWGDRIPRMRKFAFAAILATVVVGGTALIITHPWDPNATRTAATTPADTSWAGFPGVVETLKGQDGSNSTDTSMEDMLNGYHDQLGDYSSQVDQSEELLLSEGVSGSADTRSKDYEQAQSLSIEVSNLIDKIDEINDGSSTYSKSIEALYTMGSWLRNRCDILTQAWKLSANSQDIEADKKTITDKMSSAADYKELFSEKYDSWEATPDDA